MGVMTTPAPLPNDPLKEHERQTAVRRIQRAMADGLIEFDDLDERFDQVFKANTRSELTAALSDLPTPTGPEPRPLGQPIAKTSFSLFGDLKLGGWIDASGDLSYSTVFGDIVIDLSSADLPQQMEIRSFSLFGDTTVIVPDGTRAVIESVQVFGDRKVSLAAPYPGAPMVTVKPTTVFGDAKLYSLSQVPEGRLRKLWRSLRNG
jgi:hypothetical protein